MTEFLNVLIAATLFATMLDRSTYPLIRVAAALVLPFFVVAIGWL